MTRNFCSQCFGIAGPLERDQIIAKNTSWIRAMGNKQVNHYAYLSRARPGLGLQTEATATKMREGLCVGSALQQSRV